MLLKLTALVLLVAGAEAHVPTAYDWSAEAHVPTAYDRSADVKYVGSYIDEVETFLAVPYGQDTGGNERFRPPRPYTPACGSTIYAQSRGPACPQPYGAAAFPLYLGNITEVSEDCLHLNIARPNGTRAYDKLPVMLHIHGGSFFLGSKDEPAIQPGGLILQSVTNGHPVMVVEINYRLGVFGFPKSEALIAEGAGNVGLKDQRLAIEWVQKNIGHFGGDCEKITIFGQSSGGLAVGLQIMAYGGSKPAPFQRAICESQALEPGITGNVTDRAMRRLVNAVGCNTTDIQSAATASCLRNLSMTALLTAQDETHHEDALANIGDEWLPIVDGEFLPAAPSTLINEGRFYNITTMIGWCDEDVQPFVPTTITTTNDTFTFFYEYASMSPKTVNNLLSLYPLSEFHPDPAANLTAHFYRAARILRDILMVCEPFYYGEAISKAGNDVYFYDQNQTILTPILDSLGSPGFGVVHTSEFAYAFGNLSHYDIDGLPYHPTASDYALRDRESRSWSTFAALGHPSLHGHDTLQGWGPAYAHPNQTDVFVIGGAKEGLYAIDGPRSDAALEAQKLRERCAFINSPEVIAQLRF